jgi:hypothetical protein
MPNARVLKHKLPVPLEHTLDRRLVAYAAAAAAAGIGAMATVQPANAEVVFTKSNESIVWDRTKLDLNHDGIQDFEFDRAGLGHLLSYVVDPHKSNRVFGTYFASALSSGVAVGPNKKFLHQIERMEQLFTNSVGTDYFGPWLNARNRFLGLEFKIDGQPHFGWARITFTAFGQATISGYAYETIPNKPIVTGDIGGSEHVIGKASPKIEDPSVTDQPTLGGLAQGVAGIAAWRRENESLA